MSSQPRPPAVLVVDDTPANLVAMGAVLKPLDVRLVEAPSGAEALARVAEEAFAVVLLDVQMPEMDGFECARRIRALPGGKELPILFLTAIHRDEPYVRKGFAAGAADYITKPFDIDVLRAKVRAFTDLFRQREEIHQLRIEERTRERDTARRRLDAFERISTAALATDDVDAFLHELATVFVEAAEGAESVAILLAQDGALQVRAAIGYGDDGVKGQRLGFGEGIAGAIASTGEERFLGRDEIATAAVSPWLQRAGLEALYGVPLVANGEIVGVAHVGSRGAREFSEPDKRLFRALADRAAWALSRQLARDRMFGMLEGAPVHIAVWRAPAFTCEFANATMRSRYAPLHLLGRSWRDLGGPDPLQDALAQVVSSGVARTLPEVAVSRDWAGRGADEERVFRVVLHPLHGEVGKPPAVLSYAVDLTQEVRARREIERTERERARLLELERDARREAEAANQLKDEFLQTVSHELRTPLNAILGWTSSARRGAVADVERALSIVERNARAQARLIDDILDLSRIVRGKLRLEVVSTDISLALVGAIEAIRPAAEAKGVNLALALDPDLPIVAADADRIQQVIWNLLSNAIKFTPRDGTVRLSARADEAKLITVEVSDTGEGISPDFLPIVFEPFRQGDGSTTRRHGGLGLGLAIARQLVHAHGGTIRAESDGPGKGARFVVELPVRRVPALAQPPSDKVPAPPASRLDATRVLVVDDEEDTRELVREVLRQEGADVQVAASADEALERLKAFLPDVLVTDIGMPKMDGFALLRNVRALPDQQGGKTPAIALTAYARAEDVKSATSAGFQLHLAKPVDPMELVSRVAALTARPRS